MKILEGDFTDAKNYKIAIVVSRFNDFITEKLLDGALYTLKKYGVKEENITVLWVPGSFEIPLASKIISKNVDGVICIGVVIKGDTVHFDFVANQNASGVLNASLETQIPIIYGILTTETVEQALNRAGIKMGNKGSQSAIALIEMISLLKKIKQN